MVDFQTKGRTVQGRMQFFHKCMDRKLSLRTIFFIGTIIGAFAMNAGKKALLENTGLLDENMLYQMKYNTVDSSAFFWYVLRERMGIVIVLSLLAPTYLGIAVVWLYTAWLGISLGMLLMASVFRYGVKGLLLMGTACIPHYILYIPVCILLLKMCQELCEAIYFPARALHYNGNKKALLRKDAVKLVCIIGVVIMGCFMESYVNPNLIANLLKIF